MHTLRLGLGTFGIVGLLMAGLLPASALSAGPKTPADGYDIHVQAPHMMDDGTVGGPFHHYCRHL